jgi:hypothetical protein
MIWRQSLGHPVGLALLGGGALLAGLLALLPALAAWSERAPAMLLVGLAAYGATAGVAARWPASPQELRRLRAARREIARLLTERHRPLTPDLRPEWDDLASEALLEIDEEIAPALVQLLIRTADLNRHLTAYEDTRRHPPDPLVLEDLWGIHTRQRAAIATCVQRVVNSEAALLALLQEPGDAGLLDRLRRWVGDLAALHSELALALTGPPVVLPEHQPVIPTPEEHEDERSAPDLSVRLAERPGFEDLVREALRHLNKLADLAECGLIACLPCTLREILRGKRPADRDESTPLERAQALREVLVAAIERLDPGDKEVTDEALQYRVLREEYILGMSTKYIWARHAISDSTLHRRRREGLHALAKELSTRERILAQRVNPVALDDLG